MWDALGWALSESLSQANQTSGVLENAPDVLTKAFRSLAEGGVRQEDGLMLDWLPKEGMSGSVIHLETWKIDSYQRYSDDCKVPERQSTLPSNTIRLNTAFDLPLGRHQPLRAAVERFALFQCHRAQNYCERQG